MNRTSELVENLHSSTEVFKGKLLHVYYDEARLPDGAMSTREWIRHPGACAVVPLYANGDILLIRQYRYPVKQIFWEVPAGKIDPGEVPDETALRELKEEAGAVTSSYEYVGHFYPAIGYSDEVIHIYAGWDLTELEQETDHDEFVIKERLPFKEAIEMVHNGQINDGKTIICLLRVWEWVQSNPGVYKI
ncbi:MAG: NUDIX hydrolase [Bacteroidota bacterium]